MMQLPLPKARTTDPETSHEAAMSVMAEKQRYRVWVTAMGLKRFTDQQLQAQLRAEHPSKTFSDSGTRTRRSELVKMDLIVDSGTRAVLPSGRRSIIWAVIER